MRIRYWSVVSYRNVQSCYTQNIFLVVNLALGGKIVCYTWYLLSQIILRCYTCTQKVPVTYFESNRDQLWKVQMWLCQFQNAVTTKKKSRDLEALFYHTVKQKKSGRRCLPYSQRSNWTPCQHKVLKIQTWNYPDYHEKEQKFQKIQTWNQICIH